MKTPEGVKNALKLYASGEAWDVSKEVMKVCKRALTYIKKLESRLAQVEQERDAAVFDLGVDKSCYTCEYGDIYKSNGCNGDCNNCEKISCPCESCRYKWRGVCEENTHDQH